MLNFRIGSRDIRVNCICPAMVWTDLIYKGGLTKEDLEQEQLKYPLKRYGYPVMWQILLFIYFRMHLRG